ncbi:hypothetical protein ABT349_33505, partial [Streptomyces microflavus]
NVWYDGWFRTSVWLLQLPIAALLLLRLLRPAGRGRGCSYSSLRGPPAPNTTNPRGPIPGGSSTPAPSNQGDSA